MSNRNLFSDPFYQLPRKREDQHFPAFLQNIFEQYRENLGELAARVGKQAEERQNDILHLCDCILKAVDEYHKGFPSKAYTELEKGLESVQDLLLSTGKTTVAEAAKQNYYRIRTGTNYEFSRDEMFHVPFSSRQNVSTQRYSIPGLPCFYLGNSVYVCWEELKRPNIHEVQVSRVEAKDAGNLNYLDLSRSPQNITATYPTKKKGNGPASADNYFLYYLATWPLIAACSVQEEEETALFKPEYIVPQLLLEWVRLRQNFDGIKYFSTRIGSDTQNPHINYAIPVRNINLKGYCTYLSEKFVISEPINWQLLNLVRPEWATRPLNPEELKKRKKYSLNAPETISLGPFEKADYLNTIFGRLEIELEKLPVYSIHEE